MATVRNEISPRCPNDKTVVVFAQGQRYEIARGMTVEGVPQVCQDIINVSEQNIAESERDLKDDTKLNEDTLKIA